MAIFDPPDGSTDPRPRCTGHCCRCFSTDFSYAELQADYEIWKQSPAEAKIPDVAVVAPMLVPLGSVRRTEIFTCKHLSQAGNCTIYETRPKMCREFPGPGICPYKNCGSHGEQPRWLRVWNWLTS